MMITIKNSLFVVKTKAFLGFLFIVSLFFIGCNNEHTPRPKAYFRIDLPEKKYVSLNDVCPYAFEYPTYAQIQNADKDTTLGWRNIFFPQFKATIYLSYQPIIDTSLTSYIENSRTFAMKHISVADGISDSLISIKKHRVYGVVYQIEGNAASSMQFYVTDSLKHFLRGSLYFNVEPNADSISPVNRFIQEDIFHLISTLEWKEAPKSGLKEK